MNGLKIVLPKSDGVKTGNGTMVFFDGVDMSDSIKDITITVAADEIITAKMTVNVSSIENLDHLVPVFGECPIDTIEKAVSEFGYKLVKI